MMKLPVLGAALAVLLLALPLTTARAWDCVPGVVDSLEAQQAGLCVEVGQPLPTPTVPPATPEPPPAVPPAAVVPLLGGPQPGRQLGEVCHYEPTTGQWEIRRVIDGNARVLDGDEWPMKPGLCDQHHPTLVPTVVPTATLTPAAVPATPTRTPVPTAPPPPVEITGVQATPEPEVPTLVPDVEPESAPEPVPAPAQIPKG